MDVETDPPHGIATSKTFLSLVAQHPAVIIHPYCVNNYMHTGPQNPPVINQIHPSKSLPISSAKISLLCPAARRLRHLTYPIFPSKRITGAKLSLTCAPNQRRRPTGTQAEPGVKLNAVASFSSWDPSFFVPVSFVYELFFFFLSFLFSSGHPWSLALSWAKERREREKV